MARYGQAMKDRVVVRLLPPESAPIETVSRDVGISVSTLECGRGDALSMPAATRAWSAASKMSSTPSRAGVTRARALVRMSRTGDGDFWAARMETEQYGTVGSMRHTQVLLPSSAQHELCQ